MRQKLIPIATVCFTLVLGAAGAWSGEPPQLQAPPSPPVNFHKVTDALYRGGRPTEENVAYLKSLGVKTVIDLQGGDLDFLPSRPIIANVEAGETPEDIQAEGEIVHDGFGMNFYSMPLNSLQPVTQNEAHRIDRILALLQDKSLQPVYVHCAHGADRTGMIIALHRVCAEGWSIKRAHEEMYQMGHDFFHQAFTGAMDSYFEEAARACAEKAGKAPPRDTYFGNSFDYPFGD